MLFRHLSYRSHHCRCSPPHEQIKTHAQQPHQAVRYTAFQRSSVYTARRKGSYVTRVAKDLLAEIEALKTQADVLDSELQQASRIAEVAAKRSRRLANRSQELQAYAIEHILLGDEAAARAALLQKASVADALAQATRRAEANSALARKLEDVLTLKQAQLLGLIKKAKQQTDVAAASSSTAVGSDGIMADADLKKSSSNRGLKRSPSVAWSSPSLHASSDGWEQQLLQQDDLLQWDLASGQSGGSALNENGSTEIQEGTHDQETLMTTGWATRRIANYPEHCGD